MFRREFEANSHATRSRTAGIMEKYYNFCAFQDILDDDKEPGEFFEDRARRAWIGDSVGRRFAWTKFNDLPAGTRDQLRGLNL